MSGAKIPAPYERRANGGYPLIKVIILVCLLIAIGVAGGAASSALAQASASSGSGAGGEDPPKARDDRFTATEDRALRVRAAGVLRNDGGVRLSAVKASNPKHGRLSLKKNGSFVYTPDEDYNGNDSFAYKARNGAGKTDRATVRITVKAANDAPVARGDAYRVQENETLTVAASGVLRNDADTERNGLSAIRVSSPQRGGLTLNRNGSFEYRPSGNFNGEDSFTYRATDGRASSRTATVRITVSGVNDAPAATFNAPDTVDEGSPVNLSLTNVVDPDAPDTHTYRFKCGDAPYSDYGASNTASCPTNDEGALVAKGQVRDGNGGLSPEYEKTVTVNNVAPTVTAPDDQSGGEGSAKAFDLGSFTDPGDDGPWQVTVDWGDGSQVTTLTAALPGSLGTQDHTYVAEGSYTATVAVAEAGTGTTPSDSKTFTVTVTNAAPTANAQSLTMQEDGTKLITLTGGDPGGDPLTFKITSLPASGKLYRGDSTNANDEVSSASVDSPAVLSADKVTYVPNADYDGSDSFDFEACDDGNPALCDGAGVSIGINAVNDAPTVSFDSPPSSANEGEAKTFAFTVTDPDAGDTFAVRSGFPDCGTGGSLVNDSLVTGANGGSFECRFPDGPANPDARIQVADSQNADSNVAGQSVAVANVKPSISLSGPGIADEGETKTYDFTVTDPGEDTHAITTACGSNGQKVQGSDQYDQQTKAGSFRCLFPNGPETTNVTATATDSDGAADTDNRRVEVTVANAAPTAQNLTQTTEEDTEKTITLAATDPANDPITFSIVSLPANGTLHEGTSSSGNEITGPGVISGDQVAYEPDADFNGSDSFAYKASDGAADSNTATVSISVNAVNDAPANTVPQGPLSTGEGENLNITGISVDDVDAGANNIQTTLGVDGGTLTANGDIPGGATVADNGTATVIFSGTLEEINTTLGAGLSYTSATGGSFTLTVATDDAGHTGSGGAKTDTDTVTIVVDAAPAVTTTTPANGATDVATDGNIAVDFSEPVDAGAGSFELKCPATDAARTFTTTGDGTNSITLDPDADLPGATECQVRVVAGQISDTDTNDPPDNMAADHTFTFTTAPKAVDDAYGNDFTVTGNVRFDSQDASTPFGVLGNDGKNDSTQVTSAGWQGNAGKTEQGGDVTVRADGTFEYDPPAGYEGLDRFTYTISGGSTATVTLKVGGMVWFVDENATTGGDGRLSSPFDTLAAFNTANTKTTKTATDPASGDNVFLYESNDNYAGGVTLLDNQKLIGQDAGQSLAEITNLNPPSGSESLPATDGGTPDATRATIVNTNTSGNGVTLAQDNTLRGLTVGNTSGSGIKGTNVNNASMGSDVAVSGDNGGAAVDISGGNGTVSYDGTISNTAGGAVSVMGRTGGTTTFGGAINATGGGISVQNNSGGTTVNFNGSNKTLNTGANNAVLLGSNTGATVNFMNGGLDIDTTSGRGFFAGGGTLNVTGSNNTINATNTNALGMSSVTIGTNGATFDSVTSSGGTDNINLVGVGGGNLTMNGGTLSGATDRAFAMPGASTANITYAGTISNSGKGIFIDSTGGTVTFSGNSKALNTGSNPAVTLDNNDAGTVRFTNGGLDIDTTSGTGFNAVNGASAIEVSGPNNTINSGTGTALNVTNSNIGSSGLNFRSISAGTSTSGPTNGIVLSSTGNQGGLTVTGNGSAGSGGTIQNTGVSGASLTSARNINLNWMNFTNANGVDGGGQGLCDLSTNAGCNGAIKLNSVTNVALDRLDLNGSAEQGINGINVTNFDLSNSTIRGAGNAINESGIYIFGLFGTQAAGTDSSITNTTVTGSGSANHNVFVRNSTATNAAPGAADRLLVSGSSFINPGSQPAPSDGITVSLRDAANFQTVVQNSTFRQDTLANGTDGVDVDAGGNSTSDVSVTGSTFNGAGWNQAPINISGSGNGRTTFNVSGNPEIKGGVGNGVNVIANGGGSVRGTIANNPNITTAQASNNGIGISVEASGFTTGLSDGTAVVDVNSNTVTGYAIGLRGTTRGEGRSAAADLTIRNNTITAGGNFPLYGVYLTAGNGDNQNPTRTCVNLSDNQVSKGTNPSAIVDYALEQWNSGTFQIQGLTGSGTSATNVQNFVSSRDTGGASVDAVVGSTVNYTNATCATP